MSTYISSSSPHRDVVEGASTEGARPHKKRKKKGKFRKLPRWQRTLIIMGIALVTFVGGGTATAFGLLSRYEGAVHQDDLMGEAAAPAKQVEEHWQGGPLNFLLLGSDSRAGENDKGVVAGERSDTIMLLHISAKRDSAVIISIPRDSYVMIPESKGRKAGMNKLNAAFAFGGAPLAVKTVSQLTGITLDGAMIASFAGIRTMVDVVGGVEVCLDYEVKSSFSNTVWKKGCQHMDGKTAEEFMRNRKNVPGGDFGRMHDQQLVVRGIINKVSQGGMLSNPLMFDKLLLTAAQSLTIDKTIDINMLARSVKNIRPDNVKFGTVPYTNPGLQTPAGSAVQLDDVKGKELFEAIRNDTMAAYFAANPAPGKPPA
jgi:LCP family protein required for cell wall assembly